MSESPSAHLQAYHPATFLERGVAVPFTTPMLAGTRARPMDRGGGVELIVPNPSGAAGAYILPWNAVRDLCRPTLHDMQLYERVAALSMVTPSGIRDAARAVAADGLAGQAASVAAKKASATEQQDRLLANFLLLLELVKQGEPPGHNPTPPEDEQPDLLERRARQVIATIAPQLNMTPDKIAIGFEQLAGIFARLGVGRHIGDSRISRAMGALSTLRQATRAWSTANTDNSAALAAMISEVANITAICAKQTIASAHTMLTDLPLLLRHWDATPTAVARRAARPEWLLDGWEQICLIWEAGENPLEQRAALTEMALMAPIIPREVNSWTDGTGLVEEPGRSRRAVRINEDWRTGLSVLDLIARNEHLRALAA